MGDNATAPSNCGVIKLMISALSGFVALASLASCNLADSSSDASAQRQIRNNAADVVDPEPSLAVMDKIEERIVDNGCVGRLDRWARLYSFDIDRSTKRADPNRVLITYLQAGSNGHRAGRRAAQYYEGLDDDISDRVYGSYTVDKDEIAIDWCGPNVDTSRTLDRPAAP